MYNKLSNDGKKSFFPHKIESGFERGKSCTFKFYTDFKSVFFSGGNEIYLNYYYWSKSTFVGILNYQIHRNKFDNMNNAYFESLNYFN